MDQTIGVVSSSLRVGRSGLAIRADSSEVRSKHFHSSFFVASVDESQRRSSAKSVPVGCLGDPWEVVLQECVICGVSVHDGI